MTAVHDDAHVRGGRRDGADRDGLTVKFNPSLEHEQGGLEAEITLTIFPDVHAASCQSYCWSFDELTNRLRSVKTYAKKDDCPLLKLATFGELRSEKNSFRHDANVLEISGVQGDYDGEEMSLAVAQMLLFEQDIAAVIYTTPSHTEEKPRWRVNAPLSRPYPPSEHKRFVARLNGALGGILAPESFNLSQSYYVGRVDGVQYEVVQVRGTCIDLLDELDEKAIYPPKNNGESKADRLDTVRSNDPVIAKLTERNLLLRIRADGGADTICPFEGEHTTPRAPGDCTYFPAHTGGFKRAHFHCLHSHCASRSDEDFMRAIGIENAEAEAKSPASENHEWPASLDLKTLAEREPQAPKSIMEGIPCGYATGIFGHGGAGKSVIALFLAVCIAIGMAFFGFEVTRRKVLYISCEDRADILHWRLTRICAHLGVDLASLAGWLQIIDLVGRGSILFAPDPRTGHALTAAYGILAERMRDYGSEVLFLDGITDVYGGNENARSEVKGFINMVLALILPDTGALILVGHVNKATASSGSTSEGYSGSTAWHNSFRARWFLYPESIEGEDGERVERTGKLILELQKSNHGEVGTQIEFEWDANAHLFVGRRVGGEMAFDRKHRDREEQEGILRALRACATSNPPIIVPAAAQGPRTAYHVLSQRAELPDTLRSGKPAKRRFWRHIESLRQIHAIEEVEYQRKDRHFAAQLTITAEGMRECGV